jgi:hypothetical protein
MPLLPEQLTPGTGFPFGFDPDIYKPMKECMAAGIFLAPDDSHIVRLRGMGHSPTIPTNLLFEHPASYEEEINNARLYATVAEFHLSVLGMGSFGANVPEHETAIGLLPGQAPDEKRLAIYRKIPRLIGRTIEAATDVPVQSMLGQVILPRLRYYEWLACTEQPFFLGDLVAPRGDWSYSGEQDTLLEDGKTVVLHDLDPPVWPRNADYLHELLRDMYGLSERINELEGAMSEAQFEALLLRWADVDELSEQSVKS